jgi:hypothetical protein
MDGGKVWESNICLASSVFYFPLGNRQRVSVLLVHQANQRISLRNQFFFLRSRSRFPAQPIFFPAQPFYFLFSLLFSLCSFS